ncbi:MAG: extracellular solute-binding protein [Bacteroidota bacterium]
MNNSSITRLAIFLLAMLTLTSCSSSTEDALIVYSGRSKALVDELADDFTEETGIKVKIRYGNDAELMAVLQEEGDQSPADIYWANTAGALTAASSKNLLTELPEELLSKPSEFTSEATQWIPVSARFRVLAYNSDRVNIDDLPSSVLDLPSKTAFQGKVGWTPSYSSFYDFLTAMRDTHGDEIMKTWLTDMQKMDPKAYSSNTPMIQALAGGEINIALTNHYYVLRLIYGDAKVDDDFIQSDAPIKTYHFDDGDVGNVALVTGAGILKTSQKSDKAQQFLEFLLSKHAQSFAANTVHEYPVITDVDLPNYMLSPEKAHQLSPNYDYEELENLEQTLDIMRELGLL